MQTPKVIKTGKDNGEEMVIHYRTSQGTNVYGLGIPNLWGGEGWDLGPTWCYLIVGPKTILIDTGRFGNFDVIQKLLKATGKVLSDINIIIVTHSHEDHDGNLPEILTESDAELWAHTIYPHMIAYYPDIIGGAAHPELPGSCRFCFMPEEFYSTCIPYHRKRSSLSVDRTLADGEHLPEESLHIIHTPGHTPDSICIILEDEAIFTGDTVLPDITPHPSSARYFDANCHILPEPLQSRNTVYGLMVYINSLKKLAELDRQPFAATFPGHRLFYNGDFNLIHSLADRAREIVRFHAERCSDILRIIKDSPRLIDDIAVAHFSASQLKGSGHMMARSELTAHLEVLLRCGDIEWNGNVEDPVAWTGTTNYLGEF